MKKVVSLRASWPPQERPPTRAEVEILMRRVRELALKAPEKAATVLTAWIKQPKQAASPKKKAG